MRKKSHIRAALHRFTNTPGPALMGDTITAIRQNGRYYIIIDIAGANRYGLSNYTAHFHSRKLSMNYITSLRLIYNEAFIAVYDQLKECKEKGGKVYFSCDEGETAAQNYKKQFAEQGYDIFDGVISYTGGREQSAKVLIDYAKKNGFDATKSLFITNSDREHHALLDANIHSENIMFYDRETLVYNTDQLIPSC